MDILPVVPTAPAPMQQVSGSAGGSSQQTAGTPVSSTAEVPATPPPPVPHRQSVSVGVIIFAIFGALAVVGGVALFLFTDIGALTAQWTTRVPVIVMKNQPLADPMIADKIEVPVSGFIGLVPTDPTGKYSPVTTLGLSDWLPAGVATNVQIHSSQPASQAATLGTSFMAVEFLDDGDHVWDGSRDTIIRDKNGLVIGTPVTIQQ